MNNVFNDFLMLANIQFVENVSLMVCELSSVVLMQCMQLFCIEGWGEEG